MIGAESIEITPNERENEAFLVVLDDSRLFRLDDPHEGRRKMQRMYSSIFIA